MPGFHFGLPDTRPFEEGEQPRVRRLRSAFNPADDNAVFTEKRDDVATVPTAAS